MSFDTTLLQYSPFQAVCFFYVLVLEHAQQKRVELIVEKLLFSMQRFLCFFKFVSMSFLLLSIKILLFCMQTFFYNSFECEVAHF